MSEGKTGLGWFEASTKAVPVLIAVGTFLFGIYQYNEGQRRTRTQDFYQTVWKMRVAAYESITNAVGNLMKFRNGPEDKFRAAKLEFEQDYWGQMILVEDSAVAESMASMQRLLEDYDAAAEGHEEMLKRAAAQVVLACRAHLMAEKQAIARG